MTPVRTYQNPQGQYCREYTQQVSIGGVIDDGVGQTGLSFLAWKTRNFPTFLGPFFGVTPARTSGGSFASLR